jgi:hypothetical protein
MKDPLLAGDPLPASDTNRHIHGPGAGAAAGRPKKRGASRGHEQETLVWGRVHSGVRARPVGTGRFFHRLAFILSIWSGENTLNAGDISHRGSRHSRITAVQISK